MNVPRKDFTMDELKAVRQVLTERPAPRPAVVEQARHALAAALIGGGALEPVAPRRRRTGPLILAAIAAASAIAVAVATGAVPSRQRAVPRPDAAPAPTAASILLAAAQHAAKPAATAGRYWVTRTLIVGLEPVGPANNRYDIRLVTRDSSWTPLSASGTSWDFSQDLGARPASAADVAAWRRSGSPRQWTIGVGPRQVSTGRILGMRVSAAPGRPSGGPLRLYGKPPFALGLRSVTVRDLLALPTKPAALRAYLLRIFRESGDRDTDMPGTQNAWLFEVASGMLTGMPLTPATRAAAYRMLASVPGVRSLGRVRDADGRPGLAVAMTQTDSEGVGQDRLVIDPATGLGLAQEIRFLEPRGRMAWLRPGELYIADVITGSGWSNAAPSNSAW